MNIRRLMHAVVMLGLLNSLAPAQAPNPGPPEQSSVILRTETRLVLVDAVVTDKKGGYLGDLAAKDFRVWEDNKEQPIKTFSYEGSLVSPTDAQKQYVMFLFDATTMSASDQGQARQTAAKFAAANSAENWMMAVADFRGSLQITQNFTQNQQLVAKALSQIGLASLSVGQPNIAQAPQQPGQNNQNRPGTVPNPGMNANGQASYTAGSALASLGVLARNLGSIQGRKTLILFAGQLTVSQEQLPAVTALVNACNRSNITIYPVDVRGVFSTTPGRAELTPQPDRQPRFLARIGRAMPQPAALFPGLGSPDLVTSFMPQARGGGAPGGGATGGGATGGAAPGGGAGAAGRTPTGPTPGGTASGGRGGPAPGNTAPSIPTNTGTNAGRGAPTTNPNNPNGPLNPNGRGPNTGIPNPNQRPLSAPVPFEEIAHLLADGTGGFEVRNTNDILAGLVKVGQEQSHYYLLGFTPPTSDDGSCHKLRVDVSRSGSKVRSRAGYCDLKPRDVLSGKPAGKALETRAAAAQSGTIGGAAAQVPYFFTGSNLARVNVALEIPGEPLKFGKQKGKYHAAIDVLGIAYLSDGTAGARFSDTLKLDFDDQKQADAFKLKPLHYENQFDINSGAYTLKIVFSAGGESFGKVEMPLVVGTYEPNQFGVSALALSKETHAATDLTLGMDSLLIDDQTPLIANGLRVVPAGSNRFKKADPARFYVEVYEPVQSSDKPGAVGVHIRILDRKTLEAKTDTGLVQLDTKPEPGSPVIPVTATLPVGQLMAGSYLLELQAVDAAGNTARRVTQFDVE